MHAYTYLGKLIISTLLYFLNSFSQSSHLNFPPSLSLSLSSLFPSLVLLMGDLSKSQSPKNFYNILGIPKSASLYDIGKAYRSLVVKWHPDRNPSNKAEAEAKFSSINEAYRVSFSCNLHYHIIIIIIINQSLFQ